MFYIHRLQKPDNLTLLGSTDSIYKRRRSTEDSNHSNRETLAAGMSSNSSAALLSPRHFNPGLLSQSFRLLFFVIKNLLNFSKL